MANFSMGGVKEPLKPADFMPSQWAKKPIKQPKVNRNKIARRVSNFFDAQIQAQEIRKGQQ